MSKFLFLSLVILFFSCSDDDNNNDYPDCLQITIDNYIKNYPEPRQQPATISKYLYQNKNVYIFDPGSDFADLLFNIVDDNCVSVCEFGGIAGIQTCEDWDNAKLIAIVWEDER